MDDFYRQMISIGRKMEALGWITGVESNRQDVWFSWTEEGKGVFSTCRASIGMIPRADKVPRGPATTARDDAAVRETDRLVLRPWREGDGAELQHLFNDPAVRGGRNLPPERVARLAEASLRQWRVNGFGPWAAIHKATGSWIGRIGLDELHAWPDAHRIEVGFELHTAWWGQGLATEGARAALRFGFQEHGLERIISVTAAAHTAARRVMEKAGLEYGGTRYWMSPDVPVVWYGIDRAVWEARQG